MIKWRGPPLPPPFLIPLSTEPSFLLSFLLYDSMAVPVMRSMSKLNIKAPPPSPIPTATGSRSAASEILTDFLEKSLQIPDLTLPECQTLRHHGLPDKVDFQSLGLREVGSVERFMRSARKYGVVAIGRHGIDAGEEVRATVKEAARVFGVLEERDTGYRRNSAGKREEIVWVDCKDERMEWARQYIGVHLYHSFSEKVEKVASKLEEVAEELGKILVENARQAGRKGFRRGESVVSIYKYNNNSNEDNLADQDPKVNEEENGHCCDYTLSLHLPTKHCQFSLKTGPRLLTFDEWSMGEFKCVRGRIIYPPEVGGSKCSFSTELKCSSINITHSYKKSTYKMISLADQFFVAVLIFSLYSIFMFKTSP
ncbi:2-oxoglutarate (2OG) and Fe(II)-dependent oxygenase superfamily protein [Gossypium australe]|uniref:2-oxoglutarate (2OG) and Fe(II)-dependent oxygenase superfamily protein n=1 Tax=Gossypium australe TaxID=47621 RepID=A0A5B6WEB3_9ROSI|nr:2-oxoglutarate (2OG) and Fe(II)-dependent oxygenase superfamily protein [Gossypium australe]